MPNYPAFSVLIIVKNRQTHLLNQLSAIPFSSLQPKEIIVVHMNQDSYDMPDVGVPLREYMCHSDNALPLAKARNMAASMATTEMLVFLDVDCIPAVDCFALLLTDCSGPAPRLCMADPHYLQVPVKDIDFTVFEQQAVPSPARPADLYGVSDSYELFWSLGFAVARATFDKIGGFDASFTGYGGEDTDFAFSARQQGVEMYYSKARVYHQPHASYDPPLNWLADIVHNSQIFYNKWGLWPMEGWLTKFKAAGFIAWDENSISVLRLPTESEITM